MICVLISPTDNDKNTVLNSLFLHHISQLLVVCNLIFLCKSWKYCRANAPSFVIVEYIDKSYTQFIKAKESSCVSTAHFLSICSVLIKQKNCFVSYFSNKMFVCSNTLNVMLACVQCLI